ncbi:phosphoribosyltransferase [Devosia albogilva]|uniref:Phosphoribosyltransferase n=1 Tax=Devosia albogilva TaxID=429726 RepID=A0ABW5QKY9_9HYPH
MFADRVAAGKALAEAVAQLRLTDPLVVALPRGGVPVGHEVAQRLGAPLDVLIVRKLGAPGHAELAMGAIVGGAAPQTVFNPEVMESLRPSPEHVEAEIRREQAELARREAVYAADHPPLDVHGRTVVVVDDGLATGATAEAALRGLRQAGAAKLVLAVPVGAAEAVNRLEAVADTVVCLSVPFRFEAVGQWYSDFRQVSDEEVIALLRSRKNGGKASR